MTLLWTAIPFAHESMNIERDFQFIFKNRKKQKSANVTKSNRNDSGSLKHLTLCDEKIWNVREKRKHNYMSSDMLVAIAESQ